MPVDLRDYFASRALPSTLYATRSRIGSLDYVAAATAAYRVADAMLAANGRETEYQRGRTTVLKELQAAIERFNDDDSKGIGDLIDAINPFLVEAEKGGGA